MRVEAADHARRAGGLAFAAFKYWHANVEATLTVGAGARRQAASAVEILCKLAIDGHPKIQERADSAARKHVLTLTGAAV
ncbi:hypothetical protein [Methylobacterium gnaphalii]|uniref:Uncharacterized protein n=1 Tax=Methylobacterium gnaphalii TaxID=1010610 RepID=A0A512JPK4_9HYPH|nr:hypothetical protein [Methylobacterium gnaphalii]GEP11793.1 hypothetical protein MGN01_36380 [Methylobacterium gnaphalii]GJD69470.1 hypothetical protein MMMDOFMJ_2401 [Methylobacterium gnaphalii]GLS49572.1 hypothetical protein GCM10007885_24210 [Methylobacterium gnaphalii]